MRVGLCCDGSYERNAVATRDSTARDMMRDSHLRYRWQANRNARAQGRFQKSGETPSMIGNFFTANPRRNANSPKLALIRKIGEVRRNRTGFSFPKTLSVDFQRRMEKEMKAKSKISGYAIRSGASAVFLSVAFIALSSASNSPNRLQRSEVASGTYAAKGNTSSQPRAFSFAERVAFQRAIEDVY